METLASDLNELIQELSLIRKYGCSALKPVVLRDMTLKQLNDTEWRNPGL